MPSWQDTMIEIYVSGAAGFLAFTESRVRFPTSTAPAGRPRDAGVVVRSSVAQGVYDQCHCNRMLEMLGSAHKKGSSCLLGRPVVVALQTAVLYHTIQLTGIDVPPALDETEGLRPSYMLLSKPDDA